MRYAPIASDFYTAQRQRLTALLEPNSLCVLNANDIMPTGTDGTMRFRQNSDLFYLTGIVQEETILLLCPDMPNPQYSEILFLRESNDQVAIWEGHKLTKQEARERTGIQTVLWLSEFPKLFRHLMTMGRVDNIYLNTNEHYRADVIVESRDARFIAWCQTNYPLHTYRRLAPLLASLRSIKQPPEIAVMQTACDITEAGFRRTLKMLKPGIKEYEIEAEFLHEFVRAGASGFAYEPIIGAGANSCILHYIENENTCQAGDVLLLDVGAAYGGYHADMTRTIPISGRYTQRQRNVYNAVLRVMHEAMGMLRPGVKFFDYQKEVQKTMQSELVGLKFISHTDIKNQSSEHPAFMRYFMHGVSHQLGLDVHDVGNMYDEMQVGQVWTVEPGIYIREENMGIRIENNVQIHENGVFDLMRNIPIEADEIETLMNEK